MKHFGATVLGELNLDLIPDCLLEALPGESECLVSTRAVTLASSSAMFGHDRSWLSGRMGAITQIGRDPLWQIALERLAEVGVDVSKVKKGAGPSQSGLSVTLAHGQSRHLLTDPVTTSDASQCKEDHV